MFKGFGQVNDEGNLFKNALSLATTFGEDFQFQRNSQAGVKAVGTLTCIKIMQYVSPW